VRHIRYYVQYVLRFGIHVRLDLSVVAFLRRHRFWWAFAQISFFDAGVLHLHLLWTIWTFDEFHKLRHHLLICPTRRCFRAPRFVDKQSCHRVIFSGRISGLSACSDVVRNDRLALRCFFGTQHLCDMLVQGELGFLRRTLAIFFEVDFTATGQFVAAREIDGLGNFCANNQWQIRCLDHALLLGYRSMSIASIQDLS
jgi:hypothetical protein